jgi:hypothetical protein
MLLQPFARFPHNESTALRFGAGKPVKNTIYTAINKTLISNGFTWESCSHSNLQRYTGIPTGGDRPVTATVPYSDGRMTPKMLVELERKVGIPLTPVTQLPTSTVQAQLEAAGYTHTNTTETKLTYRLTPEQRCGVSVPNPNTQSTLDLALLQRIQYKANVWLRKPGQDGPTV